MASPGTATPTRFIARQPIFDRQQKVAGYELLFRQTEENRYTGTDPDLASQKVMDMAVLVGVNVLSNGNSIYVNCTRDTIMNGYVSLFPPEQTVLELLETVDPDAELISACRELRGKGYRIALDDFVDDPRLAPLTKLADIIKVDFRLASPAVRAKIAANYRNAELLAEKIETHEEFAGAAKLGYSLFQGFFFCKPVMLSARDIAASRATYLRVLRAIHAPELDYFEIEGLIKSEPALCYRLFRYLNSPVFAFHTEIKSIVQGLTLLGERDLRKWLTVACAALAGEKKPAELVALALVRARFCELLAHWSGASEAASFMGGLFSLIDAILDTPIASIVKQVQLPSEVNVALLGGKNRLRTLLDMVLAFEAGEWARCEQHASQLGLREDIVSQAHVNAVQWVQALQIN